jgi:hypothetical protein
MTGSCPECGFDWALGEPEIVSCITGAPTTFRDALGDPSRPGHGTRVRPEVWSPLEYVAHTGDALSWYGERIRQIVDGRGRLAAGPDWDALLSTHIGAGWSLRQAAGFVGAAGGEFGAELDALGAVGWRSTGATPGGARRSLVELARRAAHEVHHHAFDVRRLLTAGVPLGHTTPSADPRQHGGSDGTQKGDQVQAD